MRKDLKLKSADCGWRSAVSTGPTGGTVVSRHAHHWMAASARACEWFCCVLHTFGLSTVPSHAHYTAVAQYGPRCSRSFT